MICMQFLWCFAHSTVVGVPVCLSGTCAGGVMPYTVTAMTLRLCVSAGTHIVNWFEEAGRETFPHCSVQMLYRFSSPL